MFARPSSLHPVRGMLAALAAGILFSVLLLGTASVADGAVGGRPAAAQWTSAKTKALAMRQMQLMRRVRRAITKSKKRRARPKPKPAPVTPGAGAGSPVTPPSPPAPQPAPVVPAPGLGGAGRFGVSPDNIEFEPAAVRDQLLDSFVQMGARWIRFDVKWEVIQNRGPSAWDFWRYDELAAAATSRGLKILGTLAYAPPWARSAACPGEFMCEPRDANEYAAWAARTVEHFKGRIDHWELWNEPNHPGFWKPKPNVAAYAALVKAAYPRIKAANPNAYVLAGATSPAPNDGVQIDEVTFLQKLYEHGVQGHFDGWSHHPYTHPAPPGNVHPDCAWYQIYGTATNMRGLMAAHGDGAKQVWGTEYGPPSHGSPGGVGETTQAQWVTDAYRLWSSYSWAGPLFWYSGRDLAAPGASSSAWEYFGLLRRDLTPKPAWHAYRAAAAAAAA